MGMEAAPATHAQASSSGSPLFLRKKPGAWIRGDSMELLLSEAGTSRHDSFSVCSSSASALSRAATCDAAASVDELGGAGASPWEEEHDLKGRSTRISVPSRSFDVVKETDEEARSPSPPGPRSWTANQRDALPTDGSRGRKASNGSSGEWQEDESMFELRRRNWLAKVRRSTAKSPVRRDLLRQPNSGNSDILHTCEEDHKSPSLSATNSVSLAKATIDGSFILYPGQYEPTKRRSWLAMEKRPASGSAGSFLVRASSLCRRSRRANTMSTLSRRSSMQAAARRRPVGDWRGELFDGCLFLLIDFTWLLISVALILMAGSMPTPQGMGEGASAPAAFGTVGVCSALGHSLQATVAPFCAAL